MTRAIGRRMTATVGVILLALVATAVNASSAAADTWQYPGGVSCTQNTATTYSSTSGGLYIEHRAEGYGGYYYASWPHGAGPVSKDWGWYQF